VIAVYQWAIKRIRYIVAENENSLEEQRQDPYAIIITHRAETTC